MNKISVGGFTRITRKEARKRYNAGDGFNTVVARSREFDTVVNAFTFYNCNAETGRYPAFYVKGV